MNSSYLKKQSGYTLIELLVVMGIVGILASVGIPSYKTFLETSEFSQAYNNLYNAYRFARAEAIKTSSIMVISSATGTWSDGWEVYDSDDSTTQLLYAPAVKSPQLSVSATPLLINSRGSVNASGVTTFTVTDSRNSTTKYICILQSGQSYQSESSCPS